MEARALFIAIVVFVSVCSSALGGESPAARAYFGALLRGLDELQMQVDAIAAEAEADSEKLVGGGGFVVQGDGGLRTELLQRPGAMQGLIGSRRLPGDVVFEVGEDWPSDPTLRAARAWVYQVELFAACTRRGKVPVIQQSFELDTRRQRFLRYGSQVFHHDRWLEPIAAGELGRRYLAGLRGVLTDLSTASWNAVVATCFRASDAQQQGGSVWIVTGRSMIAHHLPRTGNFKPWTGRAGVNDFVIAVGDDEVAGGYAWGDIDAMRSAGRGVAWVLNGYNTQRSDLRRRELLVDLWAPVGDGCIKLAHYDVALGPTSGVAASAVVHAIAEHCKSAARQLSEPR